MESDSLEVNLIDIESSAVKSLGGDRVGGYAVRFGDATRTDLVGDFFTPETDFYDLEDGDKAPTLWNHNLDPELRVSLGKGSLSRKSDGIWYETQLVARKGYEDKVRGILKLVEEGKVGFSSGTPPHMMKREPVSESVKRITHWQIAEVSLTTSPCEFRNTVQSLKSFGELINAQVPGEKFSEQLDRGVELLTTLVGRCRQYTELKRRDGRKVPLARIEQFKALKSSLDLLVAGLIPAEADEILALQAELLKLDLT